MIRSTASSFLHLIIWNEFLTERETPNAVRYCHQEDRNRRFSFFVG